MEENLIQVYVKLDSNNVVTQINSSIFIENLEGWIQMDEGNGDKYSHAQGNYFPIDRGVRDNSGKYNYKLVDGKVVELTDEEKAALFPTPKPQPTETELLKQQVLETQTIIAQMQYNSLLNTK